MAQGTRRDVLRAAVMTVAVPAAVVAVTLGITFAVANRAEGWSGLGYAVVGLGVAAVLGTVAVVLTARVAFARALPAGQRLRPALAAVAGVAALVVGTVLSDRTGAGRLVALVLLALPIVLPLVAAGHLRARWVAALLTAAVAVGVAGAALEGRQAEATTRAALAAFGDDLPLAGGTDFESPLPGYRHLSTRVPRAEWDPEHDLPLDIQWRRGRYPEPEDNYVVSVSRQPTDCAPQGGTPTCVEVGTGDHGRVLRHDNAVTYLFVQVGEVEWRVDGLDDADALAVLDSLEAVDAETFWRADQRSGELD
ncbi:hypothetical protein ACWFNE_00650 [Cellulomonas sp. NPDC055163]